MRLDSYTWPERPTCHEVSSVFTYGEPQWDPPEVDPGDQFSGRFYVDRPYRSCSYCGSIHPEDLLDLLMNKGASLSGSDWKYGWPHKFYVENAPTGLAGVQVVNSSSSRPVMDDAGNLVDREQTYLLGTVTHCWPKWYNMHLLDAGYSNEALSAMFSAIEHHSHVNFYLKDGRLGYNAPRYGYQR